MILARSLEINKVLPPPHVFEGSFSSRWIEVKKYETIDCSKLHHAEWGDDLINDA